MLFWIAAALMTAAAAAALLVPILRAAPAVLNRSTSEEAVYRDQLRELDRDRSQGLIAGREADYARAEIGRRLIAAAGETAKTPTQSAGRHGLAVLSIVVLLPVIGLCLYITMGSPGIPAQPLQARLDNPGDDIGILIVKAEQHLARNPDDGAGWDLLAPIYLRAGRVGDAELAYRNALRILGPTAPRLEGLAETLITASAGVVTQEANAVLEQSLKLDASRPRALFLQALGLEQAGRAPEALAAFQALKNGLAEDSPWRSLVEPHIADNTAAAGSGAAPAVRGATAPAPLGNPTDEDVKSAQGMSATDRQAMIAGMVESLDAKLKADPNNFEGWMRLLRSYGVLGQPDKAALALKDGLAAFPGDTDEGRQLLDLGRSLGLAAPEVSP